MLIDTHAHLNFRAYDKDRDQVIQRCEKKPMKVINVGAQFETSRQAVELARGHESLYATVGLHPIHVFDEPFDSNDYSSLISDKVVAIGETGFDYWWFKYLKEPYKIILLHGWGGSKDERFFIWLEKELAKLGHQVIRFNFPDSDNPKQDAWTREVEKQVGYVNGKILFVGFSLGGVTALRYLEGLDEDIKVGGVYLLGAPLNDLGYSELSDFFRSDFNWQELNHSCQNYHVYNSTNDEVVPPEHGQEFAKKLKTKVRIVEGAWHFNIEELPQLLDDIKETISKTDKKLPAVDEVIEKQKEIFLKQVKLAKEHNLPLMLHGRNGLEDRDVYQEMLEILKKEKIDKGVFHCYGGDLETAQKIVKAGYLIGIDGPVTFARKAKKLQQIAKETPLEKILIETDCPYLAPEPQRGKRNEPVYVEFVAEKIAELKGLSKDEVIERTWQNAKNLFNI